MSENYNIVEGRIQHKNDIEANWKKAVNFIPLEAEVIVYLPDEEHKTARIKVGDGITNVNELPFASINEIDGYLLQGENNQIYNPNSTALGDSNIAGGKVFNIINKDGIIVTIDSEQRYQLILDSIDGLEIDMPVSVRIDANFDYVGYIKAIDTTTNIVTISKDKTISDSYFTKASGTLWIPGRPDLGTTTVNYPAHVEGYGNIAQNMMTHVEGYDNQATGRYSHVEGSHNKAAFSGHAEGAYNEAIGETTHVEGASNKAIGDISHAEGDHVVVNGIGAHGEGKNVTVNGQYAHGQGKDNEVNGYAAHVGGENSQANGNHSFVHGLGLQSSEENQAIVGSYNEDVPNAAFVVGTGTSTERKNGFVVTKDGTAIANSIKMEKIAVNSDTDTSVKGFLIYRTSNYWGTGSGTYNNYCYQIEGWARTSAINELLGLEEGKSCEDITIYDTFLPLDYNNEELGIKFNIPTDLHILIYTAEGEIVDGGKIIGFIAASGGKWTKPHFVSDTLILVDKITNQQSWLVISNRPDLGSEIISNSLLQYKAGSTIGKEHKSASTNGLNIGTGLIALNIDEVATGHYNQSGNGTLFTVGNGTDNLNRSNAFEVKENGDAYIQNKLYVDGKDISENSIIRSLKEKYSFYYYDTLANAVSAINADTLTSNTVEQEAVVGVYKDESNVSNLVLLQDVETTGTYTFDTNIKINLGGRILTITNENMNGSVFSFNKNVSINGDIEGSSIDAKVSGAKAFLFFTPNSGKYRCEISGGYYSLVGMDETTNAIRLFVGSNKECSIRKVIFNIEANVGTPVCITFNSTVDNLLMDECKIKARLNGGTGSLSAIAFSGATKANITNTEIYTASVSSGSSFGILASKAILHLKDNHIFCDAPNNGTTNGALSQALSLQGGVNSKTYISGGTYFGTHTAISAKGSLYVTGGRFTSCAHGGIYFSQGGNAPVDFYIENATLGNVEYDGEFDASVMENSPLGAFYIGGGSSSIYSNNKVYMNNCTLLTVGEENSGALRNTSGETDNILYISNTIIPTSIRVDEGNYIVAGESMSITESNVSDVNSVSYTDERYIYNPYVKGIESALDKIIAIQNSLIGGEA